MKETEKEYIEIQKELSKKINLANTVDISKINTIAGVDLAYWKQGEKEFAACCIVVLDYDSHKMIERQEYVDEVKVPYIPGCLAFREIPLFMEAYKKVENEIELMFFDGNGYLHPRHMGLATHAGILLDKPTVGIAKSYYKIENVDFQVPSNEQGAYEDIVIHGEVYGRVLRTHKNVKPVFLSVGNRIDLETATKVVNTLVTKESHIPVPTRLADLMTHEVRKQYVG